ncbi:MAG: hypothetical protein H6858_00055 [Rhodospirillales bacterium]|nr:hypothetical protein [Alphaproteobacteria bacterium]MCB9975974.1 hypothetical protein [Rhodospirillales bacterium]
MKPYTRLLASASFTALAGCASVPGEITDRNDPDGYERISKQQDGNKTVFQLRNGCVVTDTVTQEPNSYHFHSELSCPWDEKAEP